MAGIGVQFKQGNSFVIFCQDGWKLKDIVKWPYRQEKGKGENEEGSQCNVCHGGRKRRR